LMAKLGMIRGGVRPNPSSVIFAGDAHATRLHAVLPGPVVRVENRAQLCSAVTRGGVVFVDLDRLPRLAGARLDVPIIAIASCKPGDALATTIHALESYTALSHVMTSALLESPRACTHLAALMERLAVGPEQMLLGAGATGRLALLAAADRRSNRLERMADFFAKHNVSERTIAATLEVAEELVMNALYDAPSEAGYFTRPRQRVENVELPPELACEISYGLDDQMVFVRVRDHFGSLSQARLVQVLARCNTRTVTLDESRGGAGLGLWRVFAAASAVAISVVPGVLTEILVGIAMRNTPACPKQLHAVHLFFTPKSEEYESLTIVPDDEPELGLLDQSVTLIRVA